MRSVFSTMPLKKFLHRPIAGGLLAVLSLILSGCTAEDQLVATPKSDADAQTVIDTAVQPVVDTFEVAAVKDVAPDVAVVCPGGVGCACKADGDCPGSACLPTDLGKKCAGACNDKGQCSDGAGCKTVTASNGTAYKLCVARMARLCELCVSSASCKTLTEPNSHCVATANDKGASGFYCAPACEGPPDCPPGYSCSDMLAVEGSNVGKHCVPNNGECGCSGLAKDDLASSSCSHANGAGVCKGTRSCSKNGLQPCTAKFPAVETCNGQDDNCDGLTDEGALCEDNNLCTTDTCGGGLGCNHVPTTKQCNDGNDCTSDSCDPKTGCKSVFNGQPCDDGTKCTTDDACSAGKCVGKELQCDDSNPCTDQTCKPTSGCLVVSNEDPCSDNSVCTSGDKCKDGKCIGGPTKICDDKNPCTNDGCDIALGCTKTSADAATCDDGDACTLSDACTASTCTGLTANCNDSALCTLDACAPKSGCTHLPSPATPCDDGNACTTNDACGLGTCQPGATLSCNDSELCTADACDPLKGCSNVAVGPNTPCTDGTICTLGDVCSNGTCAGTPQVCDDKNPCTEDFCDKTKGCDSKVLNGGSCAIECYVVSTCNSGVCKGSTKAGDGASCASGAKTCSNGACGP